MFCLIQVSVAAVLTIICIFIYTLKVNDYKCEAQMLILVYLHYIFNSLRKSYFNNELYTTVFIKSMHNMYSFSKTSVYD